MARSVSSVLSSIELKRPCSAAVVRSIAYLPSALAGRGFRLSAFALSLVRIPARSDMARPVAVSHRQSNLVFVLRGLFIMSALFIFDRASEVLRDSNYNGRA